MQRFETISLLLLLCITAQTTGQLYTDDVSDGSCKDNPVAKNITACLPFVIINILVFNFRLLFFAQNFSL